MAIEKMLFVRLTGPVRQLGETLIRLMSDAFIHPEETGEILTGADGYAAFAEPCPFDEPLRQIEAIAQAAGDAIDPGMLTNVFGTDREMTDAYLKKLIGYVSDADFDASDINVYLSGLKPQTDAYAGERARLEERERYLTHRVETLSHFTHLGKNAVALRRAMDEGGPDGAAVHFGCLPRDSMMKLYRCSAGSDLRFRILSSDDRRYWGWYTAAPGRDEEAGAIMASLYFEELELPADAEDVTALLEDAKAELEEIRAKNEEIASFWQDNTVRLTHAYATLLDLRQVWSFRAYAVRRDDQFHLIFWTAKNRRQAVTHLLNEIRDVEYEFRKPDSVADMQGIAQTFPFEDDVRAIERLAAYSGVELKSARLHNALGTKRELTRDYLDAVADYITGGAGTRAPVVPPELRGEIRAHALKRLEIRQAESDARRLYNRLRHFADLEVPIGDLTGARYMSARFGRLSNAAAKRVQSEEHDFPLYFEVCDSDDVNSWCVYLVPDASRARADDYFAGLLFKEYDFGESAGTPREAIARVQERLASLDAEKDALNSFLRDNQELIELSYSILLDLRALWCARNEITFRDGKYRFAGRVSRPEKQKYETLYNAFGGFDADGASEARRAPEPPTKLKNARLFRPFEFFVEMYGMPRYGSMDITPFVAVTYTVLFGIMFGDLGQGAVLVLGGLILWLKKKSRLARAIIPCGCASMVAGCVFGSVFGYEELLDPVYHRLGLAGKPVEVMESINGILVFAIGIGVSLVIVSILINIIGNVRKGRWGSALFDNNGLAGLVLYVLGVLAVYGFMGGANPVPGAVAFPVMGACALLLFLKEKLIPLVDGTPAHRQSVADFIMQNFFELIEYVLSYFSNTVSFLRVGAFVLVHAGMMMVVFSLAGESRNIFIVILGNALIIALEGLLSGIQALRLEFYEMFSRCYEGGGKPFRSFDTLMRRNAQQ